MKKIALTYCLMMAVVMWVPSMARADATASGQVSFSGITVTPSGGTVETVTNASGEAYAQATFSQEDNKGASPSASVTGDFSTGSASADSTTPGATANANGSIIGVDGSDNAEGQGTVTSWFMINGGTGSVDVNFSTTITGSYNVLTDAYGLLAQAETVFALEVTGTSALFNDQFNSIGPSDSESGTFTTPLTGQLTLEYNTPYELLAQVDSEISLANSPVPEPQPGLLLGAGIVVLAWLACRRRRRLAKGAGVLVLALGTAGISHATYIGGDAPSPMNDCGSAPTMEAGGTMDMSLTEGNLVETYPVVTLNSGYGTALDLTLTYDTENADGSKAQIDSGLGAGWTHSYNMFLFEQRGSYFRMGPDGRVTKYQLGAGGYVSDSGYFETFTPQSDGSYIITNKFGQWWHYASVPQTTLLVGGPVDRLIQMGDRNGNVTTLTYTNGLLAQVADPYGRTVTFGYMSRHLATVTDPMGRTTQFQYDSKYRTPIRITDPNGKVTRYTYNSSYQITKKIDRDGRTYFYLYRNLRPWAVVDGGGQTWFALQNPNNWAVDRNNLALTLRRVYAPSTTTKIDGRGNSWTYQYDTNGYVTRLTAPDGATTSYVYDSEIRRIRAVTNANGNVTTYQYDPMGNRTNMTDALGHVTSYTYDPNYGQLTSVTDPNGHSRTFQYDSRGNPTNETDPLSYHRTYTYDPHGNVLSRTDKDGRTFTYQYNEYGNPTNVIDPRGNVTRYTYDFAGSPTTMTDPLGRVTSYTYQYGAGRDDLEQLVERTNALGGVTTYTYDGGGRMTSDTTPQGNTTTYTYDPRGRLASQADGMGSITSFGYDGNNNRIETTDPLGRVTTFEYDGQNRRIAETNALGDVTTSTYDPEGNRLSTTDANDYTTRYTYDALDRMTSVTDPLGHTTRYDYAAPGGPSCCSPTIGSPLVTRLQDADGHVTFYTYDELNRLTSVVKKQGDTNDVVEPSDAVTSYTYDPVGNRLSTTDPMGNTTSYGYDELDRVIAVTNATGNVMTNSYDSVGNLVLEVEGNGNVITNTYDFLDRTIATADAVGLVTTNTYDADGDLILTIDGNGNVTTHSYDAVDRRVSTTDPLGRTTYTLYDAVGNVVTNTDRNGNSTRYDYDGLNRRTDRIDALGHTTTYAYDPDNNVTNITDANGHVTSYTYDELDRRLTETYPEPALSTITYTYDGVGNVLTCTDQEGRETTYEYSDLYYRTNQSYSPSGNTEQFTYDLSGRMISADRNGWVDTFGYDGANRLIYTTQNGQVITYGYDIAGRQTTNTYPSGRSIRRLTDPRTRLVEVEEGLNPPITTYTYDAADRVLERTNGNGVVTTYTYDADNRVLSLETSNTTGRVVGFGYAYDYEGNRVYEQKRHETPDSEAYVYDGMNRLTDYRVGTISGNTVPSPALEKTWTLDPLGNWSSVVSNSVTETRTHGPANELLAIDTQTFTYDADGNLAQDTLYNYTYDEENRLVQIERLADSAIVGRYFYDALGRRVIAIADPAGTAVTNVYFYDGSRLIEEQDAGGTAQATYVYGNYLDELLTMNRSGQVYYYHQNSLWSTHALTDSSGNIVERYTYDAYGAPIVLDAGYGALPLNAWGTAHSAVTNHWLYTGREFDEEAGLQYNRARYYDSVKGRWLERDPAGYIYDLNLYGYVRDNPVNRLDPDGLAPEATPGSSSPSSQEDEDIVIQIGKLKGQVQTLYTKANSAGDVLRKECISKHVRNLEAAFEAAKAGQAFYDAAVERKDKTGAAIELERLQKYLELARHIRGEADDCAGKEVEQLDPLGPIDDLPLTVPSDVPDPSMDTLPSTPQSSVEPSGPAATQPKPSIDDPCPKKTKPAQTDQPAPDPNLLGSDGVAPSANPNAGPVPLTEPGFNPFGESSPAGTEQPASANPQMLGD